MDKRRALGNNGEDFAARFLEKKGYRVLARQWRCSYGEIDLVCQWHDEVVFVEVKTRSDDSYGFPEDSVTKTKRRHLQACAEEYLMQHHQTDNAWRVDVVAISFDKVPPEVVHIEAIDI